MIHFIHNILTNLFRPVFKPSSGCCSYHKNTVVVTCVTITYLLTPWSRVLLEKLTGFAANQEIPRFLWNRTVHFRIHKCQPPVPIPSQLDLVHSSTSYFLKIHLNIILPSTPASPKWSLSLRFPHQNPVYASPLPHMSFMPRPSHSFRFVTINS